MKILILLLALGLQQATSPVIESIQIRGNRRNLSAAIRYQIQTKPGDTFDADRVFQDVVAIREAVPGLSNVRVEQEPTAGAGIDLVFYVVESPQIRSVRFLGLSTTEEPDLVRMLADRKAALNVGTIYDEASARRIADLIESWLSVRGRKNPEVRVETEPTPPNSVVVTFRIRE